MGASARDFIDPNRDYRADLMPSGAIIGSPFSLMFWGIAQGWPASSDQSFSAVQDSDIETLLINGSIDGSTPVQFGRDELLPHLSRGHLVVLEDQGHTQTIWNSQPQALARLLNTFFDTGEVDDSLFVYQAPVFEVDTTWGAIAKMIVALLIIATGVMVLLILVIGRRLYRFFSSRYPL